MPVEGGGERQGRAGAEGPIVKVVCPKCKAKYRIRGAVPGGVKCKHCGETLDVRDGTEVIENPRRESIEELLASTQRQVQPMIPTPAARETERGGRVLPTRPAASEPAPSELTRRPTQRYLDESRLAGLELGNCRIEEAVGRGGMGVVYRATHLRLQRPVAVKVLARAFSSDEKQVGRFRREGKSAAKLNHPNVAMVHDILEQDGLHFIIMEFILGTNLEDLIEKEGPLDEMRLIELVAPVADALHAAHSASIVHRDIKPANLILSSDGLVKITDFGLAREYGANDGLTRTGQIMGTPHFMSPEQGEGKQVDGHSDIYSLGCTIYFLLTGTKPFEGDSPIAVMVSHIKDQAVPPCERNPAVSRAMSDLVLQMMGKTPPERPRSMAEVASSLRALAEPAQAPPAREPAAAAAEIPTAAAARAPRRTSPGSSDVRRGPRVTGPRAPVRDRDPSSRSALRRAAAPARPKGSGLLLSIVIVIVFLIVGLAVALLIAL